MIQVIKEKSSSKSFVGKVVINKVSMKKIQILKLTSVYHLS